MRSCASAPISFEMQTIVAFEVVVTSLANRHSGFFSLSHCRARSPFHSLPYGLSTVAHINNPSLAKRVLTAHDEQRVHPGAVRASKCGRQTAERGADSQTEAVASPRQTLIACCR